MPADHPGAEPPGLSRGDSRAAVETTNGNTSQATADVMDEADTSQSPEQAAGDQGGDLAETRRDDEPDAVDDAGEDQSDPPDVEETPRGASTSCR